MTTDLSEPTPAARVAAVRALHRRDEDPVLQTACATGDCEHENPCPTFPLAICGECYGNWEADEERGGSVPAWTLWPCATIRALDNAPREPGLPA